MGTRRWWKGDFNERRRRLDEVRPALDEGEGDDAVPVAPVDLDQVMLRDDPHTFDDLAEPGETVDAPVPVSADAPAAAEVAEAEEAEEAEVEHAEASEVEHAEAVAVDEPAVEPEPVAAPEPEAEPETEIEPAPAPALAIEVPSEPDVALPELTFEPVVVAPQNIVIDTAPKPRDTLSDLGPEAVDSDPTPVPIDPLLRLQSE